MARTMTQGFDEFLSRLTPLKSQLDAAAKHRQSVETSIRNGVKVSTFWETGSFHHGTGVRSESDIDVLVSIADPKPGNSDTALKWIKDSLSKSFPYTTVRISRPAVVVEFASGSETWEVIPGFLKSSASDTLLYDIPGPSTGWIDTAPRTHLEYVNECNARDSVKGAAKKLARLVKAWKYYCNVPVSSFYLEMRASKYATEQTAFIPYIDMYYFLNGLDLHQLAAMNDPKGVSGRFHACSSDSKRRDALSKLSTAKTRSKKALDAELAGNTDEAFRNFDLLFGGKFPSR